MVRTNLNQTDRLVLFVMVSRTLSPSLVCAEVQEDGGKLYHRKRVLRILVTKKEKSGDKLEALLKTDTYKSPPAATGCPAPHKRKHCAQGQQRRGVAQRFARTSDMVGSTAADRLESSHCVKRPR